MVVSLSFVHPKGTNVAGRYWPHQGHLGLTPLVLTGIVRARRESDYSPFAGGQQPVASSSSSSSASSSSSSSGHHQFKGIRASHVTVSLRCYEARLGRVGVVRTNVIYEHTSLLWAADPSSSSSAAVKRRAATGSSEPHTADLTQTDFPFHMVIPPASAGGCSTCHLQSYRVYWRLEASKWFIPFSSRWSIKSGPYVLLAPFGMSARAPSQLLHAKCKS